VARKVMVVRRIAAGAPGEIGVLAFDRTGRSAYKHSVSVVPGGGTRYEGRVDTRTRAAVREPFARATRPG